MNALDYLFSLPRFTDQGSAAYKPGLERMEALMEAMGRPHRRYPVVHVAGTNGKGSTSSMIAAIATSLGKKTGLHTSPHLFHLTERMRIDGIPATDEWLAGAVEAHRPLFESLHPSFFEATVALSFLYFATQEVDVAVVEVGLGGRLDATNIVDPEVSVITAIGLDHTDLLGGTLEAIAGEKAGIIKTGKPVVYTASTAGVAETIERIAGAKKAPIHRIDKEVSWTRLQLSTNGSTFHVNTPLRNYGPLFVDLAGEHQGINTALAIRTAELVFETLEQEPGAVPNALRRVRTLSGLRGRLETIQTEPYVVADVAHNPDGLASALRFVTGITAETSGRLYMLFGAMRDKDISRMVHLIADSGAVVFPVVVASDRALTIREVAGQLRKAGVEPGGTGTVDEGLTWFFREATPRDLLLVTGSHQVVSQLPLTAFSGRERG